MQEFKDKIFGDADYLLQFIVDNCQPSLRKAEPISTEKLQVFAAIAKRLRQTVLDWQLAASLNINSEDNELDTSTEIQQHVHQFTALCVEILKNPNLFAQNIGKINEVFCIIDQLTENEDGEVYEVELTADIRNEIKRLAAQILFSLKEICNVIFSILKSNEANAASFVPIAKQLFQQTISFIDYLNQIYITQNTMEIKGFIMDIITISKGIMANRNMSPSEKAMKQKAIETNRSEIASALKIILTTSHVHAPTPTLQPMTTNPSTTVTTQPSPFGHSTSPNSISGNLTQLSGAISPRSMNESSRLSWNLSSAASTTVTTTASTSSKTTIQNSNVSVPQSYVGVPQSVASSSNIQYQQQQQQQHQQQSSSSTPVQSFNANINIPSYPTHNEVDIYSNNLQTNNMNNNKGIGGGNSSSNNSGNNSSSCTDRSNIKPKQQGSGNNNLTLSNRATLRGNTTRRIVDDNFMDFLSQVDEENNKNPADFNAISNILNKTNSSSFNDNSNNNNGSIDYHSPDHQPLNNNINITSDLNVNNNMINNNIDNNNSNNNSNNNNNNIAILSKQGSDTSLIHNNNNSNNGSNNAGRSQSPLSKSLPFQSQLSVNSNINNVGGGGKKENEEGENVTASIMEEIDLAAQEKQKKRMIERQHAFQEIIDSEKVYFKNLQIIVWALIKPMKVHAETAIKKAVTMQEINLIYSNIESLVSFNKQLLKELESRNHVPIQERLVGDIFIDLAPLMKMYTEFVNNFDASMATVNRLYEERPEFANLVSECMKNTGSGLDFRAYLIMPVQRLPRYEMLLRALLNLTSERHPDYSNLVTVVARIKAINDHVNEKKRESENRSIVLGIQDKITGYDALVQPHRLFVKEGALQYISPKGKKRETYYFFAFNDMIMRTKFLKKKNLYEFKESISLSQHYLRDVKYNPFMSSSERFCFKLVQQDNEKIGHTFFASSDEEKSEWVVNLEETIRARDIAENNKY